MLTYATDFWPLFWTIIGSGAALTVLLSVLVAIFSPTWFQSRRHQPAQLELATAEQSGGYSRESKAA
jgi:hypothetical protein